MACAEERVLTRKLSMPRLSRFEISNFFAVEPYKILFPLGAFFAILASLLWFVFSVGFINFYPKSAHSNLMFFGFLWSFIAGFLMTAIPKMTKTNLAKPFEVSIAFLLIVSQAFLNLHNQLRISVALFFVQVAMLLFFGAARVIKSGKIPFVGFIFLPVGMLQAMLGAVLYLLDFEVAKNFAYLLYGEALIFNLILGLGSRLIPVISRVPNAISPDVRSKKELWLAPIAVLFLLNVGIWLQLFGFTDSGAGLKFLAILAAAIFQLSLLKKPLVFSMLGLGIKAAVTLMLLGQFMSLSHFGYGLAAMHLVYIGGFALLTIMISFRVILAHGAQDIGYEISSKRIGCISFVIALAAILRFIGMFNYSSPYISASILLLILAMLLWLGKHFKILKSIL